MHFVAVKKKKQKQNKIKKTQKLQLEAGAAMF